MMIEARKVGLELIPEIESEVFGDYACATASIYVPVRDSGAHLSERIDALRFDGWIEVRRFIDANVILNSKAGADERKIAAEISADGSLCNVRTVRRLSTGMVEVTPKSFLAYKERLYNCCIVWFDADGRALTVDIGGETAVPVLSASHEQIDRIRLPPGTTGTRLTAREFKALLAAEAATAERMIAVDLAPAVLTTFHPSALLRTFTTN